MPEPRIARIIGRRVWDSRGRPTVEAGIFLDNGASGRAIAPAGASTGTHEAVELRDGGDAFGGFGVDRAIANVNGEIAAALRSMPIADPDRDRPQTDRLGRHAKQSAARRKCDNRGLDGDLACRRGGKGRGLCGGWWPKAGK
jgi:hypothetical protein